MIRSTDFGKPPDLIVHKRAGTSVRRTDHDELRGVLQLPVDGREILRASEVGLIAKNAEGSLGQPQVLGRFVVLERLLEQSCKFDVLARIADEGVMHALGPFWPPGTFRSVYSDSSQGNVAIRQGPMHHHGLWGSVHPWSNCCCSSPGYRDLSSG